MSPKSSPNPPLLALAVAPRREAEAWLAPLRAALPEMCVELLEDAEPAAPTYAAAWGTVAGLDRCPNLKAIVSLGAGIDHILADPALAHLPVVRMIDPGLTRGMSESALLHVLYHHLRWPEFQAQQRRQEWRERLAPLAPQRRVGVMGMGVLGRDAARLLAAVGFRVAGWSRRAHRLKGIDGYAGAEGLLPFLARTDILVCLLPLTPATRGILDAGLFARLPKGAAVINLARGGHLVESDLVAALDSGHLSGASLDVFETEPLPPAHPFWGHTRIVVTPHIASLTRRDTGSAFVARTIRALHAGKKPRGLVDRKRGY
jgi:glyoxylate/hydroxypyruvate reductase A